MPAEQLLGKRVAFKEDDEHRSCWHFRVALKTGVVRRLGQTLAQKAELLGAEGIALPDSFASEEDVPRLWVYADPSASFPQGCETAVEMECLLLFD